MRYKEQVWGEIRGWLWSLRCPERRPHSGQLDRSAWSPGSGRGLRHKGMEMAFKAARLAPVGVAQMVGASSRALKGCGFNSHQGTHPGSGFDPWLGCVQEATGGCFSFTLKLLFLPLPFSISKSNQNTHTQNAVQLGEVQ